jgi:uncharacterized membrane protein
MAEAIPLVVTLYTRAECGLCDEVRAHLKLLQRDFPHRLAQVDIDSDPDLHKSYFDQIPIVEVGPYRLKAPISKQQLEVALGAARDRRGQLEQTGGAQYRARLQKGHTAGRGDRLYFWIAKHYLAVLNLIIFLYVGLPFAAPVLMKANFEPAARVIYRMYSPLCHQFGFRSFFLFGEQFYYPTQQAGLANLMTFEQATGHTEVGDPYSTSRLSARQFTGDAAVGYKVALCERDVAIYGAMLLFGLMYTLTGRRLPTLHWLVWLAIGLGPIALDGGSQIVSQFSWPWLGQVLPYRESTPLLRVLTGSLFGFGTAWFAVPNLEESMRETRRILTRKLAVIQAGR